ncbi:MAG: serine/threonine-protein kinase [Myxococcota bacterium]
MNDRTDRTDRLDDILRDAAEGTDDPMDARILAAVEHRLFATKLEPTARLGRYHIIDRIGAGGMGVVYRARDPELSRDVALKLLLRSNSHSDTARARLRQEAQALAEVSHPNVVQVYDVGEDDASLFISMELIKGIDLRQWLEAGAKPWAEVVAMFLATGRGLQAAHERGLVHRDFKPANVLLGEDGRPRVVDFGLAYVTENTGTQPVDTDPTSSGPRSGGGLTETGVALGTPAYMAPEQHLGVTADARSDQYSFCLSLYECLFRQRPFVGGSVHELSRAKHEVQPRPPAGHRVPTAVVKVVLRGLRPEPSGRWPSMGALLHALEAAARPRRARWVLGLTLGGTGLALASASALTPPESTSTGCPPAAERLIGVWDDARITALHQGLERSGLSYADTTWPRLRSRLDDYAETWGSAYEQACEQSRQTDADPTLSDRRMRCLAVQRDELASLIDVLTTAQGDAVRNAIRAATELRPVSACESPGLIPAIDPAREADADAIHRQLLEADSLTKIAQFDRALEIAEPALPRATELELDALRARALLVVGRLHKAKGQPDEAAESMSESAMLATSIGLDRLAAEAAIDLVGIAGAWRSRYDEAMEWNRHAKASIERLDDDPALEAARLHSLGTLQMYLGHLDEAIDALRRSLALRRAQLSEAHPTVAWAQSTLGDALVRAGRFDEGLAATRDALIAGEQAFGATHPSVGVMQSRLAVAWIRQGDYDKAAEHSERAVSILEEALGPEHQNTVSLTINLGQVEHRRGRLDRAHEVYLKVRPRLAGTSNEAVVLAALTDLARERGDHEQALSFASQSRRLRESLYGNSDTRVAIGLLLEGLALAYVDRDDDAFAAFARARDISAEKPLPAPVKLILEAYEGRAHLHAGRYEQALTGLQSALTQQHELGSEPIDRADVRFHLVRALWGMNRRDDALRQLRAVDEDLAPLGAMAEYRREPIRQWLRNEGIDFELSVGGSGKD